MARCIALDTLIHTNVSRGWVQGGWHVSWHRVSDLTRVPTVPCQQQWHTVSDAIRIMAQGCTISCGINPLPPGACVIPPGGGKGGAPSTQKVRNWEQSSLGRCETAPGGSRRASPVLRRDERGAGAWEGDRGAAPHRRLPGLDTGLRVVSTWQTAWTHPVARAWALLSYRRRAIRFLLPSPLAVRLSHRRGSGAGRVVGPASGQVPTSILPALLHPGRWVGAMPQGQIQSVDRSLPSPRSSTAARGSSA